MILKTKHFGEIEIDSSRIIAFDDGLPGFENIRKYVILYQGDDTPFVWLQSVDKPDLAFAMVDPMAIKSDYDVYIREEKVKHLEVERREDLLIYSIVVIPDDISKMSMNLKAPVIINTKNNRGVQVVLDTDAYSVRHYILDELRRQEVTGNAGSDKEKGTVNYSK